ncbi:MAG: GntR family transcriptional regulator [Gemmatimonadaceae bacterium]
MTVPTLRMTLVSLLRQRVTARLHLGMLRPCDRLPSVRKVAREFGVDPRVVLAAYRHLALEGLVELRERSGVFVARDLAADMDVPEQATMATDRRADWLVDRLAESLAAGIPAPMFVEHARRALETRRLRAVVLDRNGDQLWSTADELMRDYGFEAEAIDLDHLRKRDPLLAAIRRADLLVTASPQAPIRAIAASADVPLLEVSMCPDLFAEVRRLLRSEPVYFVVADPRFAAKLHTFLAPSRGRSRLRIMVFDRDDLLQIPATAPVYITRLAREHMARDAATRVTTRPTAGSVDDAALAHERRRAALTLLNRVMPDARVFSAKSARDLLAFVVRANVGARAPSGVDPPLFPPGRLQRRSAATR